MQANINAPVGAITEALTKIRDGNLSSSDSKIIADTLAFSAQSVLCAVIDALSNPSPTFSRLEIAQGAFAALSILEASGFIASQEDCHD